MGKKQKIGKDRFFIFFFVYLGEKHGGQITNENHLGQGHMNELIHLGMTSHKIVRSEGDFFFHSLTVRMSFEKIYKGTIYG